MPARRRWPRPVSRPGHARPKEGLGLINGTQFSTALALAGLFDGWRAAQAAIVTSCLSTDAIMGSTAPLEEEIHGLRGHRGQIEVAAAMRGLMAGRHPRKPSRGRRPRAGSLLHPLPAPGPGRCARPAALCGDTLETEANAVTDNPLVVAPASCPAAISTPSRWPSPPTSSRSRSAEIGAIAQRRVALMVDPTLSHDLPPFLTPDPGLNSGYMIAEVTTAALMSENKHLANPCSTDSTPTSANQEDHVSMAATARGACCA
jgi:histidine ammonia-lyase